MVKISEMFQSTALHWDNSFEKLKKLYLLEVMSHSPDISLADIQSIQNCEKGIRTVNSRSQSLKVPLIRLSGSWLENSGFSVGKKFLVFSFQDHVILEVCRPEPFPSSEGVCDG
jgi:hypothetical protein